MKKNAISTEEREFLVSLFERHSGIMYKTALDMNIREEAEKSAVVHEALLRLSKNVGTLRGMSERALVAYISLTVRSVVLNMEARRRVERRRLIAVDEDTLAALADEYSIEEEYIDRETRRSRMDSMWAALAELSETDRTLLIEKYMEGKSDRELAQRLGIAPESVRKKLTRAKRRARRAILGKEGGGDDAENVR